ncbi:MAG: MFS transporter [Desulfurococcales archaeon]|nr:MFS transporter [Desulfurococcales archaeon]
MPGRVDENVKRLIIAGLAVGISWGLAWSILAPYLRGLGYTGKEYGLVGSTAVFSGALFTLLGGTLSDRYGSRPILVVGLVSESLSLVLVSMGDPLLVATGFFLYGASNGLSMVAQQALLSRTGRDEEMHYTFSYVSAASTLGGGVGSLLGWLPVLANRHLGVPLLRAYQVSLAGSGLVPLLAVPAVWGVRERLASTSKRQSLTSAIGRLGRVFYALLAVDAIIGFGAALSIHNIDYYFTAKYHVTSAGLGTVFGVQQLVMAGLMTLMPSLADRAGGTLRVYLAVTGSSIPLLVAMTLVDNYPVAATLYLARSILMNVANPLYNAFIMRLVPVELRGRASALLSLSWTIPAGIGRAVGGLLLDIDLELPLRLTALLYTIALAILALLFHNHTKGRPVTPTSESVGGPSARVYFNDS